MLHRVFHVCFLCQVIECRPLRGRGDIRAFFFFFLEKVGSDVSED